MVEIDVPQNQSLKVLTVLYIVTVFDLMIKQIFYHKDEIATYVEIVFFSLSLYHLRCHSLQVMVHTDCFS